MNSVTINQAYLFIIFIINGILIGIIFDIFRILRRSFKTPNIITYIEDALFWTFSALTVLYTLFVFNNGEIRGYIFIGLLLGVTFYMLFFSRTIVKISVKVIGFFKNILYSILKVIIYPFKIILEIIKKILIKPCKNVIKYSSNIGNKIKKCHKFKKKYKNSNELEKEEGI